MPTHEPLILVGTGRCGSTVLHRILSDHPGLAYLTPLCTRLPARPDLNRLAMGAVSLAPGLRRAPGMRRALAPSEAYPFWEHHCPGFAEPCRDLLADDLRPPVAEHLHRTFARMLTSRRDRLLLKVTGWPRVGYLDALFSDARFVHIRRDGRDVANSWLNVDWWGGWGGPSTWRWGELTEDQEARWRAADRSFAALAALNWELLMDAFALARKAIVDDRYLDITYEELCARPTETLRRVVAFAELDWTPILEPHLASLEDRNGAWRRELAPGEQEVLQQTIEPALARHGYA